MVWGLKNNQVPQEQQEEWDTKETDIANASAYNKAVADYFSTPEGQTIKQGLEAQGFTISPVDTTTKTEYLKSKKLTQEGFKDFKGKGFNPKQIILKSSDGKTFSVPNKSAFIFALTPEQLQNMPKDMAWQLGRTIASDIKGPRNEILSNFKSKVSPENQYQLGAGADDAERTNVDAKTSAWKDVSNMATGLGAIAGTAAAGYFGGPLGAWAAKEIIQPNLSRENKEDIGGDVLGFAGMLGAGAGAMGSGAQSSGISESDAGLNASFDTGMGFEPGATSASVSDVGGFIPPASEGAGMFSGAGGGGSAPTLAGLSVGASPAAGGFFDNGNWIPTALGAGATIWGTKQQTDAAERAAELAAGATSQATAENKRQFDIGQENLAPWLAAGKTALGESLKLQGLSGDPSSSLAALQASPGYQFRLKTGRQGLDASSAARGGMGSGKAATSAMGWNQDFASSEYGNRLNQLAGMSGTGQTTGQNLANLGSQYAANQGNLWTGGANAQGAAGIAGANARTSGLYGLAGLGLNAWDKYKNQ